MTIAVDHEERRTEIMQKALRLIGARGYDDVTYQQIGDVCGLSRTTLYKYFRNKRDIFDQALLQLVLNIGVEFQEAVREKPMLSCREQIKVLWERVIDTMYLDPPLIRAIIEYLIRLIRREEPVGERVRRHTIGMHKLLIRLFREGIIKGEFRPISPETGAEMLYALLEAATLRMTLLESFDRKQFGDMLDLALDGIDLKKQG